MASWLEAGRPAILQAIAAACDKVDELARAELEASDRANKQMSDEISTLRVRAAEVDRLHQENGTLRADIQRLRETRSIIDVPSHKGRLILGDLSPNKPTKTDPILGEKSHPDEDTADLTKRCKKAEQQSQVLIHKYKSLLNAFNQAKRVLEDSHARLRMRTDAIKKWEKFSKRQRDTIKQLTTLLKREQGSGSLTDADFTESTLSQGNQTVNAELAKACRLNSSFNSHLPLSHKAHTPCLNEKPEFGFLTHVVSEPPAIVPDVRRPSPRQAASSSGTAPVGESIPTPSPVISAQSSSNFSMEAPPSDGLEFPSARPVRKKKRRWEEFGGLRRQKIELERGDSSGPKVLSEENASSQAESIDFDEEIHIPTPRKRRALQEAGPQREAGTVTNGTAGPGLDRKLCTDMVQAGSKSHRSSTTPYDASTSKSGEDRLSQTTSLHARSFGLPFSTEPAHLITEGSLSHGAVNIAEYEEKVSVELAPLTSSNRLQALIDRPSVAPIGLAPLESVRPPASAFTCTIEGTRNLPVPYGVSVRNMITKTTTPRSVVSSPVRSVARASEPRRPSILRADMPRGRSATIEQRPLRKRPVEILRPEDFKPNPQYNDGIDYVYDEVVRGKDARATLSGCVDPSCCGKTFRRFAESERDAVGPVLTSRAEDISLMERYLGGDAWRLGMMTREQKEETWLLAKTWDLANKFGKHRHRYSRMPTPPGFWSVDFPNTQERAEERIQAEKIRRALVVERHREAMRNGGAWLFRDE